MTSTEENLPDREAAATSILEQTANEIRQQKVNWQTYLQSQMISQDDMAFLTALEQSNAEARAKLLKSQKQQAARTFISLLGHISKDQTVQFLLVLVDDIIQEDKSRTDIFPQFAREKKVSVWTTFFNLLNRGDSFIVNMTSSIVAHIACFSSERMAGADLTHYLSFLKNQLKTPNNEYLQPVARCLQIMMRVREYRTAFEKVDGIAAIAEVLSGRQHFQIQYQLGFCLWLMAFIPELAEKMNKANVIPVLADILNGSGREKVARVMLATFRNLIEKPVEEEVRRENCIAMVQCKVLKTLEILSAKKYEDPDILEDIEYLEEKMDAIVQDMSSFDEYATELKSGRLEWSPVHTSVKFWKENAEKLNEKNYELLKILIKLLETSKEPLVLCVASHDIGEYVRCYPRGKQVIEKLGGKPLVMQLMSHEDANVRNEALRCVHKLMVQNWWYLGHQLDAGGSTSKAP
ncbi:V-type proton ATPase subunit H-like [Ornithodoros turicata]|uniref:V-type proton ATPase subunit H-like n=1 Tax=Ornithodoros turicata TaxID=34597 RepID=UPI003139642C